ncbi:MAG: hypothetical protein R3257_04055, partial [bacterium]|nr:hypothetical protein [bacterium]
DFIPIIVYIVLLVLNVQLGCPMENLENISNLERIKSSDLRDNLKEVLNRVGYAKERIIIQRSFKDEVGIVPVEYLDLMEKLIEKIEDYIDIKDAKEALGARKKSIPLDEARKLLNLE